MNCKVVYPSLPIDMMTSPETNSNGFLPTDHLNNDPSGIPRITASSPVRDLGPGELDYKRCAALHNELLRKAVEGSGRKMPLSPQTYWEAAAPSGRVASLLRPPVIEFLKRAYVESPLLPERGALFYFLKGLAEPSNMVDVYAGCENKSTPGTFIRLYRLSDFRGGDDEGIL